MSLAEHSPQCSSADDINTSSQRYQSTQFSSMFALLNNFSFFKPDTENNANLDAVSSKRYFALDSRACIICIRMTCYVNTNGVSLFLAATKWHKQAGRRIGSRAAKLWATHSFPSNCNSTDYSQFSLGNYAKSNASSRVQSRMSWFF